MEKDASGVVLAATWAPRGEMLRFLRLIPQLEKIYKAMAIAVPSPPIIDYKMMQELQSLGACTASLHLKFVSEWSWGRYEALKNALNTSGSHIHYVDFDRLLRWVESRPDEWRHIVETIRHSDCLVIGRTKAAHVTHPQALVQTEAISNQAISLFLGRPMDVSAGSKGFSRRTARFIIANSLPGFAFGTDAEWPILAHRGGFEVNYIEVDGLDWESGDRYKDQLVDREVQLQAAKAYDADPRNWAYRVRIAIEIITRGMDAFQRPLCQNQEESYR